MTDYERTNDIRQRLERDDLAGDFCDLDFDDVLYLLNRVDELVAKIKKHNQHCKGTNFTIQFYD